jgi:hypothetical protein
LAATVTDFRWVSVINPDEPDERRLQWYVHPQTMRFGGTWLGELEIWNSTDEPRSFLPYTVKMTSGYNEWVAIYENFLEAPGPKIEFRDLLGRRLLTTNYYSRVLYPILRVPNFVTVQPGKSVKVKIVATAHRQYQFGRLQNSYPTDLNLLTLTDGQRRTLLDVTGTGFAAPKNFDEVRKIMQVVDQALKTIKVPPIDDPAWAHVPLKPNGTPSLGAVFSGTVGMLKS